MVVVHRAWWSLTVVATMEHAEGGNGERRMRQIWWRRCGGEVQRQSWEVMKEVAMLLGLKVATTKWRSTSRVEGAHGVSEEMRKAMAGLMEAWAHGRWWNLMVTTRGQTWWRWARSLHPQLLIFALFNILIFFLISLIWCWKVGCTSRLFTQRWLTIYMFRCLNSSYNLCWFSCTNLEFQYPFLLRASTSTFVLPGR